MILQPYFSYRHKAVTDEDMHLWSDYDAPRLPV